MVDAGTHYQSNVESDRTTLEHFIIEMIREGEETIMCQTHKTAITNTPLNNTHVVSHGPAMTLERAKRDKLAVILSVQACTNLQAYFLPQSPDELS